MTMVERVAQVIQATKINGQRLRLTDAYAAALARAAIAAIMDAADDIPASGPQTAALRVKEDFGQ